MFPVALLAGGLATRLRPITETIPKALVDVAGEPFICRQLNYLYGQGIRRIVLCIGYLGEMIQKEVGDGSRFGLEVSYAFDGPVLLGTGGALKQALPFLGEYFFILYGDSFLPVNFEKIEQAYLASNKSALMTVLENSNKWDKSNVLFQNGKILEYNKQNPAIDMKHIDYGLGIMAARVLQSYPEGNAFDLADVYHELSLQGELAGYEVHERFYEIGSHEGLKETEDFFKKKERL